MVRFRANKSGFALKVTRDLILHSGSLPYVHLLYLIAIADNRQSTGNARSNIGKLELNDVGEFD
jgi:hypothetical protein